MPATQDTSARDEAPEPGNHPEGMCFEPVDLAFCVLDVGHPGDRHSIVPLVDDSEEDRP